MKRFMQMLLSTFGVMALFLAGCGTEEDTSTGTEEDMDVPTVEETDDTMEGMEDEEMEDEATAE